MRLWYKANSLSHWKARIWLPVAFQKKPPKPAEAEPSFRKVSVPPAKLLMLFPAHLWDREFWPQIYSLWQDLDWGILSKILASTKMGRTKKEKKAKSSQAIWIECECLWGCWSTRRACWKVNGIQEFPGQVTPQSWPFSILGPRGFLQSTTGPHQSTEMAGLLHDTSSFCKVHFHLIFCGKYTRYKKYNCHPKLGS